MQDWTPKEQKSVEDRADRMSCVLCRAAVSTTRSMACYHLTLDFMKQSLWFQLRNRSLLKFKSSYVIAETAVQQPPKQAAVPCAAFPEMSWLCASVCPSTEEEHQEAWPAQKVFQGMFVHGFKLHSKERAGAQCTFSACLSRWEEIAHLAISWILKHCSNTSIEPSAPGNSGWSFSLVPTTAGPGLVPCWCQPWADSPSEDNVATHSPSHGSSKSSVQRPQ